jgi:hypothetical protein
MIPADTWSYAIRATTINHEKDAIYTPVTTATRAPKLSRGSAVCGRRARRRQNITMVQVAKTMAENHQKPAIIP